MDLKTDASNSNERTEPSLEDMFVFLCEATFVFFSLHHCSQCKSTILIIRSYPFTNIDLLEKPEMI